MHFVYDRRTFHHTGGAGFVKFYGGLMDGAKLLIWAFLALCAGTGLGGEKHGAVPFVLAAAGILGVSLFADFWDANKFEPIYGLWQEEYAGAALVLAFGRPDGAPERTAFAGKRRTSSNEAAKSVRRR